MKNEGRRKETDDGRQGKGDKRKRQQGGRGQKKRKEN